jgi:hypothetical protein
MISPGAIVRVNRHANIAWVVHSKDLNGRWRCLSKKVDGLNRSALSTLIVGAGDMILIKEAPTYVVGAEVCYEQIDHTVIEDRGEFVKLAVPSSSFPLAHGGALERPSGNAAVISKANLVLEAL